MLEIYRQFEAYFLPIFSLMFSNKMQCKAAVLIGSVYGEAECKQ